MSYECIHCGTSAHSKCVRQRNIFPQNMEGALLTHVMKMEIKKEEVPKGEWTSAHTRRQVHLIWKDTFIEGDEESKKTDSQLLMEFIHQIRNTSESALKYWACDHEWKWVGAGTCDFGCCSEKTAAVAD